MPEPEARLAKRRLVAAPRPAAGRWQDPRSKQGAPRPQEDCQEGGPGRGGGHLAGDQVWIFETPVIIYKRLFLSQGGVSMQESIISVLSLAVTADKEDLASRKQAKLNANQAVAQVRNHLHDNMEL